MSIQGSVNSMISLGGKIAGFTTTSTDVNVVKARESAVKAQNKLRQSKTLIKSVSEPGSRVKFSSLSPETQQAIKQSVAALQKQMKEERKSANE